MYRNTATFAAPRGALPPPKAALEGDSELAESLLRKRQQIDREIEEFREKKEKEFRDFERNLRKQKQRRRRDSGSTPGQTDTRPGALSLLNLPAKPQQLNGSSRQQSDVDGAARSTAPLSLPTTGIDKLSIAGETLPPTPLKGKFGKTKSPSSSRTGSLSPLRKGTRADNLSTSPDKPPLTPPTPRDEPLDVFAGVFTPAYLPLLDSRSSTKSPSPTTQAIRHGSFSLPDSASYDVSPMRRSDRSKTEPVIPSNSLPSSALRGALRTASGTTVRKRKHVTFQLADSAIVEPSSSYEEMPSPSPKEEAKLDGSFEDGMSSDEDVPAQTHGLAMAVPSPDLRGRDRHVPGDLTNAVEGSGAGGFFELDEELSSPRLATTQPFVDDFEDDTSPVESRRTEKDFDKPRQTYEYGGSVPIDIVRPSSSWVGSFGH